MLTITFIRHGESTDNLVCSLLLKFVTEGRRSDGFSESSLGWMGRCTSI